MENKPTPSEPILANDTRAPIQQGTAKNELAPEAWQEFLEEDADCCGGCHHKPR